MIWRRKSDPQNSFVEAKPSLGERLSELWRSTERRGLTRWMLLLWSIVTAPIHALFNTFAGLFFWRRSVDSNGLRLRHLRHLLEGLPAVLGTLAVLAIAGVVIGRESYLRDVYRSEAAKAYSEERPEEARLFYERLFRLDGGAAETRLFLGLTLEKLDQKDEALHLIRGVAEGDAGGDPRANRWVAAQLLSDPKTFAEPGRLREAYRHLTKAERGLPDDHQIKVDLAKYHLALGNTEKAIAPLAAAAIADPALNFDLAKLYVAVGKPDPARKAIERAELHFRSKLDVEPDRRDLRLLLSTCLVNLGRLEESISVLREGLAIDPEGPFSAAIAKVYVAGYDRLAGQRPPAYDAMIKALREALRYDPQSIDAAVRLADFGRTESQLGGVVGEPEAERQAQEMLEGLLAAGEQPPAVHMALGLKAWREENTAKAAWHFERAYELDPSLAAVANNLAWALAHQSPPDLDRALAVINPVIERFPESPHYRDTRGEIYTRWERWREALADLEHALPSLRNNPRIHESLARVYDGLGQQSMANRHRDEATRLQSATTNARVRESGAAATTSAVYGGKVDAPGT